MVNYYNEIDPFAVEWLQNLIVAGYIPFGHVDKRSIANVRASDLAGYTQCHFFAGIGGWPYALRLAGWPDDGPVWTGSCPYQPFSAAGKRKGTDDERHLWPDFFRLIGECRPDTIFGEQVASKDALGWLDTVSADLEGTGYAVGAVDTCAAGVGAPHIRQRLYWVADADHERQRKAGNSITRQWVGERGASGRLADDDNARLEGRRQSRCEGALERATGPGGVAGGLAQPYDAERRPNPAAWDECDGTNTGRAQGASDAEGCGELVRPNPLHGFWRDADWLGCRDGKWRPVEPGLKPLAHGVPARVGCLRAYGNAIVPQVTAEVIRAFMETRDA